MTSERGTHSPSGVRSGKYRVVKKLADGGMGLVMLAEHRRTKKRVVVKCVRPSMAKNRRAAARFSREAEVLGSLQSEHTVRVLDVGQLPNGGPYLVMEYLSGVDLQQLLKQYRRLPLDVAVSYVLQACESLAEAHRLGIVHRDLKPANLFLAQRSDGSIVLKVLDFGICKAPLLLDEEDEELTTPGTLIGSPYYMSPEQIRDASLVDHRTDIWALGVLLQHLVTGRLPFSASHFGACLKKILSEPPTPLRLQRADAPEALERIVSRCLAKVASQRPQNVFELATALGELFPGRFIAQIQRIGRMFDGEQHPPSPQPEIPRRNSQSHTRLRANSSSQRSVPTVPPVSEIKCKPGQRSSNAA